MSQKVFGSRKVTGLKYFNHIPEHIDQFTDNNLRDVCHHKKFSYNMFPFNFKRSRYNSLYVFVKQPFLIIS